jgi:hypothetical protein
VAHKHYGRGRIPSRLIHDLNALQEHAMGCDIHWNSETKVDGKWVCDQIETKPYEDEDAELEDMPGRSRDYWLFGLLAKGVRREWPWSFPYQNQLPADCSPEVRKRSDGWDSDGHSHGSWTRAQLIAKKESFKTLRAEYLITPLDEETKHYPEALSHLDNRLEEIIGYLDAKVPDTDQRIVFFFDN